MGINIGAFIASLKYMIEGWAGIFIVMGIIIVCIQGLNRFAEKLEEKEAKKAE
ncbi:MAG: hypothetical protein IKK34_10790 [Clostridia bacterium]|nr:hypothetical protein [Clostridia bacterium]